MVISIDIMNLLLVLSTLCFSFAIFTYSLFFKRIKIISNVMGTTFFIPFWMTLISHLFFPDINFIKMIALSEILMLFFMITISIKTPTKAQMDLYQFSVVIIPVGLTLFFHTNRDFIIFYWQDMYYALTATILSVIFIILHRSDEDPYNLSKPVLYLTIAYVIQAFDPIPWLQLFSLGLKCVFYFNIMRLVYHHVHEEIMKEVVQAKKIKKNFQDEIQKEVKKRLFYMEMSKEKISKISQTDELTKALNRRGIMNVIDEHIMSKKTSVFSLLIFDIDKFKTINDTLGHIVGDQCLQTLSNIARANIRDHDALGRYGGDEFIIVLPGLDTDGAFKVAERFRLRVSETDDPHFTVSVGISTYPENGKSPRDLIDYADDGLYISKESGRNKVSKRA